MGFGPQSLCHPPSTPPASRHMAVLPWASLLLQRWHLLKKWKAERTRSLCTSHVACFLKSQGACNFLNCQFPTWRILDQGESSACKALQREMCQEQHWEVRVHVSLIFIKANLCECVISYNAFSSSVKHSFSCALNMFERGSLPCLLGSKRWLSTGKKSIFILDFLHLFALLFPFT